MSETLSSTIFENRFPPFVLTVVDQFNVIFSFYRKTLLFKFLWLEFRFKSFLELHVHFKGFMYIQMYACANCMQNARLQLMSTTNAKLCLYWMFQNSFMQKARFQLMSTTDAKLCFHWMFKNSFLNIGRQKHRNFWSDRLELWPSILFNSDTELSKWVSYSTVKKTPLWKAYPFFTFLSI